MSAEAVKILCRELIAEAEAIINYTDDITATQSLDGGPANIFQDIRLDELEHIQNLTLALTNFLVHAEVDAEEAGTLGGEK